MFARLLFLSLLIALPCIAQADTAKDAFTRLNSCLLNKPPANCRGLFTTSSLELYDRISGYDVMDCLPKETEYVSQQETGKYTMVRASTKLGQTIRYLRLAFIKERNGFKLDAPYSLRLAIGENWQKQVQMTENIYLMLKSQLGGKLNCAAVQGLAAGNAAPRPIDPPIKTTY
jgi:hypothetical protein